MSNLLLTGRVGVGKSTVVDRALKILSLRVGGVRTAKAAFGASSPRVTLRDWMTGAEFDLERWGLTGPEVNLDVFEKAGSDAIRRALEGADLVLFDELGRMELGAPTFQEWVWSALDSPKPVLAVVKPESNPFLDRVRAHPRSDLVEVREDNRDALVGLVVRKLQAALAHGPGEGR